MSSCKCVSVIAFKTLKSRTNRETRNAELRLPVLAGKATHICLELEVIKLKSFCYFVHSFTCNVTGHHQNKKNPWFGLPSYYEGVAKAAGCTPSLQSGCVLSPVPPEKWKLTRVLLTCCPSETFSLWCRVTKIAFWLNGSSTLRNVCLPHWGRDSSGADSSLIWLCPVWPLLKSSLLVM